MEYSITDKEIARFTSKFIVVDKCHVWQANKDKDGYGIFYFKKKGRKAHRVSYYITNGNIPDGMVIDHLCKNRACVNNRHLRCVTVRQNVLENSNSIGFINKNKKTCKYGHVFDKIYGTKKKQRYCSICENIKSKRLQKKWLEEARKIKC